MKRFVSLALALLMAFALSAGAEGSDRITYSIDRSDGSPSDAGSFFTDGYASPSIGEYTGGYYVDTSSHRVNNDRSILVDGECALDGDLKTAWNTNKKMAGEWIELSVADGGSYEVAGFRIANGYWKNTEVYRKNSRLKTIEIYADDRYVQTFTLQDVWSYQTFFFESPVVCSSIRLSIVDGYRGSSYVDCCVTELDLIGTSGRAMSSATIGDWGRAVQTLRWEVEAGRGLSVGSTGFSVLGLQLLLRDAFGVLDADVDGDFGEDTRYAVERLRGTMTETLGYTAPPMTPGVVDAAYWDNMMAYMDYLGANAFE